MILRVNIIVSAHRDLCPSPIVNRFHVSMHHRACNNSGSLYVCRGERQGKCYSFYEALTAGVRASVIPEIDLSDFIIWGVCRRCPYMYRCVCEIERVCVVEVVRGSETRGR